MYLCEVSPIYTYLCEASHEMVVVHFLNLPRAGRACIGECEDTYSTVVACGKGKEGLKKIELAILKMEAGADALDASVQIDMPGMNLEQHSTILMCEVCMRHSVVSYESYARLAKKCSMNTFGKVPVLAGLCTEFSSAAEYYLYVACTAGLVKTPKFRHSMSGRIGLHDIRGYKEAERSKVLVGDMRIKKVSDGGDDGDLSKDAEGESSGDDAGDGWEVDDGEEFSRKVDKMQDAGSGYSSDDSNRS